MPKKYDPRLIPVSAAEVTDGLLAQNAVYQRVVELNAQISKAVDELVPLVAEVNHHLSNNLMRSAAKSFAKANHLRMADRFMVNDDGRLYLVCDKRKQAAPAEPKGRKKQSVPTLVELRERAKSLGVDIDALNMGRQRRKIAAHLDEAVAQREGTAKMTTKMSRTGDAVPVTVVA